MEIRRLAELPEGVGELAERAAAEGHQNISTLVSEFLSGSNRFQAPGEALFAAFDSDRLIGIGGLNRDPYESAEVVARVRRLYVLPAARRQGVASLLMKAIEDHAAQHFRRIQLYTSSAEAGSFYVGLGYRKVSEKRKVSHEKRFAMRACDDYR